MMNISQYVDNRVDTPVNYFHAIHIGHSGTNELYFDTNVDSSNRHIYINRIFNTKIAV